MNAEMYTFIIVVVCVGITSFLVWKLNKIRNSEASTNNNSKIIKFLKWEENLILKIKEATHFKIGKKFQTLLGKMSERIRVKPENRFWLFMFALALIIGGQIIMHRTIYIESWTDFRQSMNDWLRVDAKYLGSVIIGLSFTLVGGLLFAITSFHAELLKRISLPSFLIQMSQFSKNSTSQNGCCPLFLGVFPLDSSSSEF